jgi:hypothetical protein
MARKYLCVYYDIIPTIDILSDAEAGRLLKGALHYSAFGEAPDLPGNERFAWPMIMAQIDRSNAKYEEQCVTNKRIATERYEKARSVTKRNESLPRQEEKEEEKEKENKKKRAGSAFAPPTLEEVRAYVAEKGLSVDPQKFYDYFTVGNWVDSKGNPVKNWKQKLLTWDRKEPQKPAAKPKQYTTAENYTPPKPKLTVEQISALVDKI